MSLTMRSIKLNADELAAGQLSVETGRAAVNIMHEDGIVCLQDAIPLKIVAALHSKMQSDLDLRMPSRNVNAWNSLRPPPYMPYLFHEIVYNEFAIDVCRRILGEQATLTTYGANTSWPNQKAAQKVHRDVPNAEIIDACPAVVINIPMMEFTLENGATLIYPGSHTASVGKASGPGIYSKEMLTRRAAVVPAEQTTGIGPGDLVIRDLRLWHGGMPNYSADRRIMLALVVIDAAYRHGDESGFKGFEAEEGTEEFWQHPRLKTSVSFVPAGDRSYYLHGHHSTPKTALQQEHEARQSG
jgi:ectoine hydroxylase-related dioxygenase (phytanoyl-CoA dioxygenase family)